MGMRCGCAGAPLPPHPAEAGAAGPPAAAARFIQGPAAARAGTSAISGASMLLYGRSRWPSGPSSGPHTHMHQHVPRPAAAICYCHYYYVGSGCACTTDALPRMEGGGRPITQSELRGLDTGHAMRPLACDVSRPSSLSILASVIPQLVLVPASIYPLGGRVPGRYAGFSDGSTAIEP
jgi:hypothetical protein